MSEYGRNGPWEQDHGTKCSQDTESELEYDYVEQDFNVSSCVVFNVSMKDVLKNMKCIGNQECRYTLKKQNYGTCSDEKKYLTLKYSCISEDTTIAPTTDVPIDITRINPLPEEISKEVIERLKAEMEIQLEKLREDKDRELKSLRDDINQELFKLQRDRDAKLDQKVNTTEKLLTVQIQQLEKLGEDKDRELKSLRDDINQELFKLQRDRDAKLDQKVNTTEKLLTVQIQQSERN